MRCYPPLTSPLSPYTIYVKRGCKGDGGGGGGQDFFADFPRPDKESGREGGGDNLADFPHWRKLAVCGEGGWMDTSA
jgi:hypothetical protein